MDPILLYTVLGALISGGVASLFVWLKRRAQNKEDHHDDVENLKKSVWRLNKTVIILAKLLDEKGKKAHPEISSELEEIAKELLESNGNLEK